MSVRISTAQFYNTNSNNYMTNFSKLEKTRQEASDGIRVRSAKDDPVGAARLLQLEQQQNMLKQYGSNITNVRNALGTAESTLNSIGNILQRVNELTISSGNAGFTDADRKANAQELARRLADHPARVPAHQAVDRRGAGDAAFQDTVDVVQRAAADHGQPAVHAARQPAQQVVAPPIGTDVLGTLGDRGQRSVEV